MLDQNGEPVCSNATAFRNQWGLHNQPDNDGKICYLNPEDGSPRWWDETNSQLCFNAIADIDMNVPEAWSAIEPGVEVVVGVIDSGINYLHPDFGAIQVEDPDGTIRYVAGPNTSLWINPGEVPDPVGTWTSVDANGDGISDAWQDGEDNDGNGYTDDIFGIWSSYPAADPQSVFVYDDGSLTDGRPHGTHVSGIIATAADDQSAKVGIHGPLRSNVKIITCRNGNKLSTFPQDSEVTQFINGGFLGTLKNTLGVDIFGNSVIPTWMEYNTCFDYFINLKVNQGVNVVAVNSSNYMLSDYADINIGISIAANVPAEISGEGEDFYDKVKELGDEKIMLITSASNWGTDYDTTVWHTVGGEPVPWDGKANMDGFSELPGTLDLPNVLSIASTNYRGNLATGGNSSFGRHSVDLVAPGEQITSLWNNQEYSHQDGTSMASPMATAAYAILASQFPEKTIYQLKSLLMTTTKPLPEWENKTVTGGMIRLAETDEQGNITGGALACQDQKLQARLMPYRNYIKMLHTQDAATYTIDMDYLSVNCDQPIPEPITVNISKVSHIEFVNKIPTLIWAPHSTMQLHDSGQEDIVNNDGSFRGKWTPPEPVGEFRQIYSIDMNNDNDPLIVQTGTKVFTLVKAQIFNFLNIAWNVEYQREIHRPYALIRTPVSSTWQSYAEWEVWAPAAKTGTRNWSDLSGYYISACIVDDLGVIDFTDCSIPIKFPFNWENWNNFQWWNNLANPTQQSLN